MHFPDSKSRFESLGVVIGTILGPGHFVEISEQENACVLQAGHVPSATLAAPSMATLTADFAPSANLLQGPNDAATGTSPYPAYPKSRFSQRDDFL